MGSFVVQFASTEEQFPAAFANTIRVGSIDPYEGQTEVTPGDEDIVLETAGKTPAVDIVVHKVPSSYGHIGYNGGYLTVY